jgi:hypothetical protein
VADFKYTAALDDAMFKAGMNRMRNEASRTERDTRKSLSAMEQASRGVGQGIKSAALGFSALAVAGGAIKFAREAMAAYDEATGGALRTTDSLGQASGRLKVSIGRDLTLAAQSAERSLASMASGLSRAREAVVDFLAIGSGGDVDLNEAIRARENQALKLEFGQKRAELARRLEIGSQDTGLAGQRRASELRAEAEFQARRKQIEALQREANERNQKLGLGGADAVNINARELLEQAQKERDIKIKAAKEAEEKGLDAMREANTKRAVERKKAEADFFESEERKRQMASDKARKFAEDRERMLDELRRGGERRELDIQSSRGFEKAARLAELERDARERILEISRADVLTAEEKARFSEQINQQTQDLIDAERGRMDREGAERGGSRALAAGLASRTAQGQVFGTRVDPVVRGQEKMNETLKRIDDKLADIRSNQAGGVPV